MSANDQKHAELIKKYSQANIDEYVKTTTLTAELEEVSFQFFRYPLLRIADSWI